jgi:16S rRNA processing protein RimM
LNGSPANDASNDAWVVLGKVGKVHGIKGWVRVISFTETSDGVLNYPLLRADFGASVAPASATRQLEVDDYKQQPKGLIAHFKGIDNPEEARWLNGATLSVERKALPPLESDEYYWYQLEGLTVINQQDECFGIIKSMLETGANDVMVVNATQESIDDRERLIPYLSDSVVLKVDLDERVIRVDWDADFLA